MPDTIKLLNPSDFQLCTLTSKEFNFMMVKRLLVSFICLSETILYYYYFKFTERKKNI